MLNFKEVIITAQGMSLQSTVEGILALSVMIVGTILMLVWSADSWDFLQELLLSNLTLEMLEQIPLPMMMSVVMDQKDIFRIVVILQLMIVVLLKVLVWNVIEK